jgi:hypothetical protein
MANELLISYPTGATLYALLYDSTGNVWNGSAFAAPGSAEWLDYDIAMTEVATATGIYRASMPAAAAGVYGWLVRKQAGASPAVGDIAVGAGEIRWTGTTEETVPASANVTQVKGATIADLDASGNVLAKLANTVTHGGATAQLALKKITVANSDNQGVAFSLRGGNPISPGIAIELIKGDGSSGAGRIGGYIDGVNNGVSLATEAIHDINFDVTGLQAIADAGLLAPTPDMPATGSVYDLLAKVDSSTSKLAQLDWQAWKTPSGVLKELYDDNAIDVLTGLPSDYAATNGAEYFSSYVMREFGGSLFIGISNVPMNGTGAIIARLDTPGGTPVFEYNLPEEGVSCMAVNPTGTALYIAGVDVRNNDERCGIYKRSLTGTWTRRSTLRLYPSEDGFQHVTGITFVGSRIYVCGQATTTAIAWSDDDGITWNYSPHVSPRCYSIGAIGTQLYELGSYDGSDYYELARAEDVLWSNYTYPINTQLGVAKNQLVNWGDLLVFGVDTDEIVSVDAAGTTVSYAPPFVLRQTYNNLVVDTDGYLCALGTTGVWRTSDLANWKQVWSFSPADTVYSLGTWGDDLVVSTGGVSAAILSRPASPEAAQQQMIRDAMQLAPTVSSFVTNSVDYYIDRIANGLTGVGLIPLTYTVTEPDGTTPISGTTVELYTEEACINCVRRGVTNSLGVITFWMTTAGTYWIKNTKDGFSFSLDSETVSA